MQQNYSGSGIKFQCYKSILHTASMRKAETHEIKILRRVFWT
jgi:hypothetical protein